MIDLGALFRKEKTLDDLFTTVTIDDLRQNAHEFTDTILRFIVACHDADVGFQPIDPDADDPYAESEDEANIAWTLGHLVVHVTASAEEAAALAAEMARGVERDGRSRYETPWETVTTIQQCRDRLEESRRMVLASLDMWPAQPNLDIQKRPWPSAPEMHAMARFISGMDHGMSHFEQIQDVIQQAKAARS